MEKSQLVYCLIKIGEYRMEELVLNVEKRQVIGKKHTKQLRSMGRVPGVYYFHGQDTIPISVDAKQLKSVIHLEASIIDLNFNDGHKTKCVIREVQWDPLYGKALHVDFMGIKLTEKITVKVPVHLIGTPEGVKKDGGILQQIIREIEIESLPLDIPEHIEIDISHLNIGDAIYVESLSIEKVKILVDPSRSIVVVRPPVVIVEPTAEVTEEEEGAEPEVVGQKEEESEEKKPE